MPAPHAAVAGHTAASQRSSTSSSTTTSSWITCSSAADLSDVEDTAGSSPAPQLAGAGAAPQERSMSGWAARPAGPPDESVRTAWELGGAEVAAMIAEKTMRIWRRAANARDDRFAAGAKHAFVLMVQQMAGEYLMTQLDEAVEELFVMGVEVGRFHLEGEDIDDSDSEAGSGAGMHDDPVEDMPGAPQWWQ